MTVGQAVRTADTPPDLPAVPQAQDSPAGPVPPEPGRSAEAEDADRPAQPVWRRRPVWAVAAAVVVSAVGAWMFGRPYVFYDMKIYHGAVEWWLAGGELYQYVSPTGLGFTYPPFAALTMLPMAAVTPAIAGWINVVASVAALGWVLAVALVPIADRMGWPRWATVAVALPLALALEPTRETLGFGQVNLLLFGLVMADMVALGYAARRTASRGLDDAGRRGRPLPVVGITAGEALRRLWFSGSWAGVGIGLATAVKLTPGLFIIYLLVSRQRRPAVVAMATAALASMATWLLAPRESAAYFTSVMWQTDRVGAADFTPNQSLAGLLARLYDSQETPGLLWLSFAALCCALGLSRAVTAHQEGDELAAFTLVGLTATIISPISWSHHLVFVVPAILIMVDAALRAVPGGFAFRPAPQYRRRGPGRALWLGSTLAGLRHGGGAVAVYVVFLISPIWWVHHKLPEGSHYDSGLLGVLAENSLALGVILLVGLMPWRSGATITRPLGVAGWPAWSRRPAGAGSSGSIAVARSRTSSPAAPTARS